MDKAVVNMGKRTGPTNVHLRTLINKLKKRKEGIWKDVAEKLSTSRRRRVEVNISAIDKYAKEGETVIVPGVVLASGDINKAVNVAAWKFSPTAAEKIRKAKGKIMTIEEVMGKNPKGSKIRIMV